jgi:3-hydroxyacyl-[acyl-carrier-protein] dehydratase
MRWVWIDRFVEFVPGKRAVAVKNLSMAEDVFAEHFPGLPLMPASLLLEGLAQTGGILVGDANQFREKVVLAKFPYARFYREVFAGEQLTLTAEIKDLRSEGAVVVGRIQAGADMIGEAEIFFAHLDQARSGAIFGERNFVFTGELRNLFESAKAAAKSS